MKQRWELKTLGDVVTFQRGLTYSKKDEVDFSANIVLRANNIELKTNKLNFSELRYIKDDMSVPKEKKVSRGSLIICTASGSKSHLGKVALIDDSYDYAFGGFMGQLKPNSNLDSKYLFYLLTSDGYRRFINRLSDGVNINNLRFDDLSGFPVPLPAFSEQKRIVKILDEVFEKVNKAKENAEKNLQNVRELFESYLQNVFANPDDEWEEKSLEELGNITSSKRIFKSEYVKEGIPFYRTKEIKELANGKSISLELFISHKRYNEIKANFGIPKEGDILLSAVGTIGEIYVVQKGDEFYFKDGNIVWLKDFDSVDTCYLKYALKSFVEQIKTLSRGSAYSALTIEKLNKYRVPIASIKEQQIIVAKLDTLLAETKKLEAIYQQKLTDLEELKKSILHKAFNGKLVGACS